MTETGGRPELDLALAERAGGELAEVPGRLFSTWARTRSSASEEHRKWKGGTQERESPPSHALTVMPAVSRMARRSPTPPVGHAEW